MVRDITDRKLAEDALCASNEKFTKIYNLSPDAIDLTHLETGVQMEVNPAHEKMFGYTREELIGHTALPEDLNMWLKKDDRERFIAKLKECGEVFGLEVPMRRKGGDVFSALLSSSLVEIQGERCLLTICRDLSERKQMEESLRESEAKFRRYIEISPIGIFECNQKGRYLQVNPAASKITGYTAEELLELSIPDILPPESKDFALGLFQKLLETGHCFGDFAFKHKSGRLGYWSVEAVSISPERFLGFTSDITELKQTEEHERRLEAKLQEAHKLESLGTLSAGVAHNLNNILAIIMGNASLRERTTPDPVDRVAYQFITKACTRGRDVVKSMLHFAEPTLSIMAPLELHTVIQEMRVLLENTTRNTINISEVYAGEPLWILGDTGSLNQVMLNLCLNSLGAMPSGGTLTLRTTILKEQLVEVSIEDDGCGMTPEVLAHALEPFYTTKEVGKGTGLGLSMTYGVVKAHGGTIDIASQPGQGTTVKLRFPRIHAPTQSEPGPFEAPAPSLASMKVFLVDDDEDVRFLMTRMLKQAGVRQPKTFSGGEKVLECLRSGERPDLIILDQNMPGMNGTQTMERIRCRHPDMPILISSGQPDIEEWDCYKQPKVAVISKPFTMDEIQDKLAQFADGTITGQ